MDLVKNYNRICQSIRQTAEKAGRDLSSVRLLVVSKTWGVDVIRPLVEAGHRVYGENRVQEAEEKISSLPSDLEWHLIGHLQKNKIRRALPLFRTIHSIDSHETAGQVDRVAHELGLYPKVFLQVNTVAEPQKHGFLEEDLVEVMGDLLTLPHLEIAGLMAIPPFTKDPEATRPHFQRLRRLRDELEETFSHPLPELSMGMTSDYEVAIEEGSTLVRVGSAIFGPRNRT